MNSLDSFTITAFVVFHSGFPQSVFPSRKAAEDFANKQFPGSPEIEIEELNLAPSPKPSAEGTEQAMSPYYLPGEGVAIAEVKRLGGVYGYGNLISCLKDAWSEHLQSTYGFTKRTADVSALHVCPWCRVDGRTGKKAPK